MGDLPTSIHTHAMGKSLQEVRPIDQHVVELQPSEEGLTVLSLYSGISIEVEAALRACLTVAHYYAVKVSMDARCVSQYRLEQLHRMYPIQLPREAFAQARTRLPQDIRLVREQDLLELGGVYLLALGGVDFLVAGWPCYRLALYRGRTCRCTIGSVLPFGVGDKCSPVYTR